MDNSTDTTIDEMREFYGIVDEGDIVESEDLEDEEVITWPAHMKE